MSAAAFFFGTQKQKTKATCEGCEYKSKVGNYNVGNNLMPYQFIAMGYSRTEVCDLYGKPNEIIFKGGRIPCFGSVPSRAVREEAWIYYFPGEKYGVITWRMTASFANGIVEKVFVDTLFLKSRPTE